MSDKFLNSTGLAALRDWVLTKLGLKMDKISSPTNNDILTTDSNGQAQDSGKTIANIDNLFVAFANVTTYSELHAAIGAHKYIVVDDAPTGGAMIDDDGILITLFTNSQKVTYAISTTNEWTVVSRRPYVGQATDSNSGTIKTDSSNGISLDADGKLQITGMMDLVSSPTADDILVTNASGQATDSGVGINDVAMAADLPTQATDSTLGTVKTNSAQSIALDSDGKLTVGGRMGQFPTTTGLFAPNDREPRNVGNYSLLMSDFKGGDMSANRSMAVVSGYGLACRSAAAGSTQYRITNNYANRIIAKLCENGYASKDEATSTMQAIVPVVSVQIGGASYTPDSSANPSGTANDIIITTEESLNPDGAMSNIRLFGKMMSYATIHTGNGITSLGGGRNLILGGGITKAGNSNDNCLVGNGIYSDGNGNACFGRHHIARKNRGFFAGTGHDSTNAPSEGASAVGQYSYIDSSTLFAVGNGTNHTARSNAFEVRSDGGIVLKSPNGTRFKIAVDDSGNLTTTAV